MSAYATDEREWLEPDGLGGFASGTVSGVRSRRYHALLLTATTPPTGRFVLVNGFDAWIERGGRRIALTSQRYAGDVIHPDGAGTIVSFGHEPWPTWRYVLEDGLELEHELFVPFERPAVVLRWRLLTKRSSGVRLIVRPFLSARDVHALHHENPALSFDARESADRVVWQPYVGPPAVASSSNGAYSHEPLWYRSFLYSEERARGLDDTEDLASPGALTFDLAAAEAEWVLSTSETALSWSQIGRLRAAEVRRRTALSTPLRKAAQGYLVRRGSGRTIVAGYPWFTDWGRDTFIALRGLCLATGKLDVARDILSQWAGTVSQGMLPNRFIEQGDAPEFNSVDASLWYVIAVHEYLDAVRAAGKRVPSTIRTGLLGAVEAILEGYARGTRHGIRMDDDALLAAGEPGIQLTWMDAKVGDWVVTPRVGKPVEIQALWFNALGLAGRGNRRWRTLAERVRDSFGRRFWNPQRDCLYDVVDVDHRPGLLDDSLRPNQIFAVGGLPLPLLDGERARGVVEIVEAALLTPLGLRSLGPSESAYTGRYEGGVRERDGAYHQGTVWPWLLGPFVEAWVRVRDGSADARREARRRFLEPLLEHLEQAGIGHISEIADADAPHQPRGCPFQAWSVAEALRLDEVVLAAEVIPVGVRPETVAKVAV